VHSDTPKFNKIAYAQKLFVELTFKNPSLIFQSQWKSIEYWSFVSRATEAQLFDDEREEQNK
jgi:hypothetical protein